MVSNDQQTTPAPNEHDTDWPIQAKYLSPTQLQQEGTRLMAMMMSQWMLWWWMNQGKLKQW